MIYKTDVVVIGAGVVGLAIASALAKAGREVLILERNSVIGSESSSRNSEVIHAGLYYAPGSLKARLCVRGRAALYRYCDEHGVGHRRCGKIVVAAEKSEIDRLDQLVARALANGVEDVQLPK